LDNLISHPSDNFHWGLALPFCPSARSVFKSAFLVLFLFSAFVFVAPSWSQEDQLIVNGGFETGKFDGWKIAGECGIVGNGPARPSRSGLYLARVGSQDYWGSLSQTVIVPEGASSSLSFWYRVERYAKLKASLLRSDESEIQTWNGISDSEWHEVSYELGTEYGGTSLTVKFEGIGYKRVEEGGGGQRHPHPQVETFLSFVDDVSLSYFHKATVEQTMTSEISLSTTTFGIVTTSATTQGTQLSLTSNLALIGAVTILVIAAAGVWFIVHRRKLSAKSSTRFCLNCGKPVLQDSEYCSECGEKQS
jgi:hypothetical protein